MKYLNRYKSFNEGLNEVKLRFKYNKDTYNNICDCFTSLGDRMDISIANTSDHEIFVSIRKNQEISPFYINSEIIETIQFAINYLKDMCELSAIKKGYLPQSQSQIYFKTMSEVDRHRSTYSSENLNVKMIDEFFIEKHPVEITSLILIFKYI